MKNFKKFNIKNTLIALACTAVFAQANAMEIDPNPFLGLPDEVNLQILQHLPNRDLQVTACTDVNLNRLVNDREILNIMQTRIREEIRSSINKLNPDIRNQDGLDTTTDINQLNTILENLEAINIIRQKYNNPEFAEEERNHLDHLFNHDYVDFFQAKREELDDPAFLNDTFVQIIIEHAIPMDANYALSFLVNYIDKEYYSPLFNPTTMLEAAVSHNSIKTVAFLLKNFNVNLNTPNSRNKTILDMAQEQLRYKLKHMAKIGETEEPVIAKIIVILCANGALTSAELPTAQQHRNTSDGPPRLPRKTGRKGR